MLKIDEKHLEDILFNKLLSIEGMENLKDRGLPVLVTNHFNVFRQFNLGEYGIPDIIRIIYHNRYVFVSVLELKVVEFHSDHLFQLSRYMTGIRNILQESLNISYNRIDVSGYLIVSDFKPNGAQWIAGFLHNIDIYTTEYKIDGLWFQSVLRNRWEKRNADHSVDNYISLQDCKKQYKNSYREYLSEKSKSLINNG